MRSRILLLGAALASCVATASPSSAAQWTPEANYTGSGTLVVKQDRQPPTADTGALVCQPSSGTGIGGGCVSFGLDPNNSSVMVSDAVQGRNVAFQVCIDNNGDGACISPDTGPCADQIFFSHDDNGNFFNPLGPLPTKFAEGCTGGGWNGYVVFLCTGAHTSGGAHSHPATKGSIISLNTHGSGFGTFCGGPPQDPSNKRYVVAG